MADIDQKELLGRWTHSHEEDEPGRMVFRPAGWKFPPARGRRSFELKPGGVLVGAGPGPDDRPSQSEGNWVLRDDGMLELNSGTPSTLRILEVSTDRLVVAR
jgi:hypothetical protein